MCSVFWKILVRSRGFDSSCHESICITVGEAPAMKGQCAAAAILAISPSISTSGGLWSKWKSPISAPKGSPPNWPYSAS
ncbi:hypothetical protein FQZ97_617940 [compost metagenome]